MPARVLRTNRETQMESNMARFYKHLVICLLIPGLVSCSTFLIPQPPTPTTTAVRTTNFQGHLEFASNLRKEYINMQAKLFTRRGLVDDAVFINGLGAAGTAVYRSSRDVIVGLGLLTGAGDLYRNRANLGEQVKIYGRAADSLQCVINAAEGIRFIETANGVSPNALRPEVLRAIAEQQAREEEAALVKAAKHYRAAQTAIAEAAHSTAYGARAIEQKTESLRATLADVYASLKPREQPALPGEKSNGKTLREREDADDVAVAPPSYGDKEQEQIYEVLDSAQKTLPSARGIIRDAEQAVDVSKTRLAAAHAAMEKVRDARALQWEANLMLEGAADVLSAREICEAADKAPGALHDALEQTKSDVLDKIMEATNSKSGADLRNQITDDALAAYEKAKALKRAKNSMSPDLAAAYMAERGRVAVVVEPNCRARGGTDDEIANLITFKAQLEKCAMQ